MYGYSLRLLTQDGISWLVPSQPQKTGCGETSRSSGITVSTTREVIHRSISCFFLVFYRLFARCNQALNVVYNIDVGYFTRPIHVMKSELSAVLGPLSVKVAQYVHHSLSEKSYV